LLFVLMLFAGTSLMAQKNGGKSNKVKVEKATPDAPVKDWIIANPSGTSKKVSKNATGKAEGNFISPTGVPITWRAMYSAADKRVTGIYLQTATEQSMAFWNVQIAQLYTAETFSALEACLAKDDASNLAPCMQATVQAKVK